MSQPEWSAPSAADVIPTENNSGERGKRIHPEAFSPEGQYWLGSRGAEWDARCNQLNSPCNWSQEYLKNWVPRIKIEGKKFRSLPRHLALTNHRPTLVELFPAPFTQDEDPKGIIVFSLCGYSNCVNPEHLPIIFRQHRVGLSALRIEVDGVEGWWTGAEHFYLSYAAFLHQENLEKTAKEGTRKHQRRVQSKLSRRKRRYTEGERARAITMLSDGAITYEMYKEIKAIFLGLSEDIFDQTMIIYATRAKDIREGKIKPGYTPDARKNPFKNFRTEKK